MLLLHVGKPLFTNASIVPRSRGVQFFGACFCSPLPELHETGNLRKYWNRGTIYAETKHVHKQLSEIRALECELKNCGKRNVMCNTDAVQTVEIQTH